MILNQQNFSVFFNFYTKGDIHYIGYKILILNTSTKQTLHQSI
jgi:hypothetical protein